MDKKDVCILIPALNESQTIGQLIEEFKKLGYNNILVMDGHSIDGTPDIAEAAGARVVTQTGKGKGQAISQAFRIIDSKYVVMIDGDGTYLPGEVDLLLEPIISGDADHCIGNRFTNYEKGAFTRLNLIGNKILNKVFGLAYGIWLNDVLSGYRAFTRDAIKQMELNKTGFEIEMEMTIESVKNDMRVMEISITYLSRKQGASTKLRPLHDGFRIGTTLYLLSKTHNPLFYFNLIGAGLIIVGVLIGVYVVNDWFKGITHVPMTILSTLFILSGIQMFILAILSDLMVSLHKENIRLMKRIMK